MNMQITPRPLAGTAEAIASKSQAHRLLICAALSDRPVTLQCGETSADIEATVRCLEALGAKIQRNETYYTVTPIEMPASGTQPDVGESGSTLRFLLPVAGALGASVRFILHGRLPERPLSPLWEELIAHGMTLRRGEDGSVYTGGRLQAGTYRVPGNVSSQFISGLLFALPLLPGDSRIELTTETESGSYLTMTRRAQTQFGVQTILQPDGYDVPGSQTYHGAAGCRVEGDWSNAAFPLCAGALAGTGMTVTGLDPQSPQGDRKVVEILRQFGAQVSVTDSAVSVKPSKLRGITVDARDIPDLVPVLTAVAVAAEGETRFIRAGRLRIKESDRLKTVCDLFEQLGADIRETEDGLIIRGGRPLTGGTVDAAGDHRIAMTAAVASAFCTAPVVVRGAQAVNKSYPRFWTDFKGWGGCAAPTEEEAP